MNLNEQQLNGLQEVINIGVGQAASVLNEMLNSHINLQIPFIKTFTIDLVQQELENKLGKGKFAAVELEFHGSVNGNAELVFPTSSAVQLVSIVTEEDLEMSEADLDELKVGALTEIGNIVISGVMGAISNLLSQDLEYLLPTYVEGDIETLIKNQNVDQTSALVLAQTRFFIEETNIQGDILLIFHLGSFAKILDALESLYED